MVWFSCGRGFWEHFCLLVNKENWGHVGKKYSPVEYVSAFPESTVKREMICMR
jgi:hypothetical protein